MVLFINLFKTDRSLDNNGTKVSNYMKKNFYKILEIHSRLISSLSNLYKNKNAKKRRKKQILVEILQKTWKNNQFTKSMLYTIS